MYIIEFPIWPGLLLAMVLEGRLLEKVRLQLYGGQTALHRLRCGDIVDCDQESAALFSFTGL